MAKRFYTLRIPFFGSVAMLLMCTVFFLLPFALRGARLGLGDMQNNVADWLPKHYPETQDLREFRKYFFGDQFVVVSGPWCQEGDPVFSNLKRKIFEESLDYEKVLKENQNVVELRAHQKGDELGLLYTGNYHEDWGEQREKWLQGKRGQWYFINRMGQLFRWEGQNNVVEGIKRAIERGATGKNKAVGTYIDQFGPEPDDQKGVENPFYQDPQLLCCRPFKSVISGPDVFERMAGPDGTLRIGKFGEEDLSTFEAKIEANKRLTGAMFGPTPPESFNWTFDSLLQHISDSQRAVLKSDPIYREKFDSFVSGEVEDNFDGDLNGLVNASKSNQLEAWYKVWFQLGLEPPPRQTCLIVTLNEPIIQELARAVGRPILGKPRGRIPELAIGECGITADNLHMGGPPCDNVAIDEEGTNTLLKLASLSLIIGVSLAYLSFGSIRIAAMLFFVGGVSAISSLAYVWFGGQTMDAILMSMPSLVYVLGLSSAVHIVNYYRDACHEFGPRRAVEIAVKHSWFPCTLAAFTTALGLASLTTSNLTPIYKFGLFSAIAVMATVFLLFTYLPSALTIWSPGFKKLPKGQTAEVSGMSAAVGRGWDVVGNWIVGHHLLVTSVALVLLVYFSLGLTKIETTVQLLKLFDSDAKILHDYRWMEENLGELVPAELVVSVDLDSQLEPFIRRAKEEQVAKALRNAPAGTALEDLEDGVIDYDRNELDLKYSMLERVELSYRIRSQLERFFGTDGFGIVGSGMSTDVFTPLYRIESQQKSQFRKRFSSSLDAKRNDMLAEDYLAVAGENNLDIEQLREDRADPKKAGLEMWRVSIRLAALNDVDYGRFVNDLKRVVEPILTAYRYRTTILEKLQATLGEAAVEEGKILVLARNPDLQDKDLHDRVMAGATMDELIDQTYIFSDTLQDLLENRGFEKGKVGANKHFVWLDPDRNRATDPDASESVREARKRFFEPQNFASFVSRFDCVVMVEDDPLFDYNLITENAKQLVDCRKHTFDVDPRNNLPVSGMQTAMERRKAGEDVDIATIYTGIVPIVYKAQRALLRSLVESIGLAFVMISAVMMLLLRDWGSPIGPHNLLNIRGGMISMLPNIFPIVIVFGFMGHCGIEVDIGSMMTASVAMGVAVDDTIHFLNWYRRSLSEGQSRLDAIKVAYSRVATAMTQTTLIGGFGLAAFALSTFTPTQRFGVLMLFLLAMALVGDLILLPALLAGPLGKYFGKTKPRAPEVAKAELPVDPDPDPTSLRLVHDNIAPEVILPPTAIKQNDLKRLN